MATEIPKARMSRFIINFDTPSEHECATAEWRKL
jgi:hypothetical protein